jgi:hypothetical protein
MAYAIEKMVQQLKRRVVIKSGGLGVNHGVGVFTMLNGTTVHVYGKLKYWMFLEVGVPQLQYTEMAVQPLFDSTDLRCGGVIINNIVKEDLLSNIQMVIKSGGVIIKSIV